MWRRLKAALIADDDLAFLTAFDESGAAWTRDDLFVAGHRAGLSRNRALELAAQTMIDRIASAPDLDALRERRAAVTEQALVFGMDEYVVIAAGNERARELLADQYLAMIEQESVDVDHLFDVGSRAGLEELEVRTMIEQVGGNLLSDQLTAMLDDRMLSPDEDRAIESLSKMLGATTFSPDPDTARILDAARRRWTIEHEELPIVTSPLILQRGEVGHLVVAAQAAEQRQRTVRVSYGGPVVSIPIMKGLRYRVGSIAAHRHTEEFEHSFGVGTLVLTDRRLLWAGPQKAIAWKYDSIIDYQPFSDALDVRRAVGKPIRFYFEEDETVALIARRLIEAR